MVRLRRIQQFISTLWSGDTPDTSQVSANAWFLCLGFGILIGIGYCLFAVPVVIASLLIIALLVSGIRDPRIHYYAFILLIFVENVRLKILGNHFFAFIYPGHVLSLIIILTYYLGRITGRLDRRQASPLDLVLCGLLCYYGVTLIWGSNPFLQKVFAAYFILNYCIFLVSGMILQDTTALTRATWVFIITGVIFATGVIVTEYTEWDKTISITTNIEFFLGIIRTSERASGFAFANTVAAVLVIAILMLLGVIQYTKRSGEKIFYFTILFYLLYSLILTESRGAFIGLLGGFMIFLFYNPRFRGKQLRVSCFAVFFAVATLLITDASFIDRLLIGFGYSGDLYFSEDKAATFSGGSSSTGGVTGIGIRITWWKKAYKEVKKRPLTYIFGLGPTKYLQLNDHMEHSIPMAFFFDAGLIGIILMMIIFVIVMSNLFQILRRPRDRKEYYLFLGSATAFIAIICIHGLINFDLMALPVWFLFGYCMAVINISKKALAITDTGYFA